MAKEIFGTLVNRWVELPFEDAKKKAEAEKSNAEIGHLGFRVVRAAYDWGILAHGQYDTRKIRTLESGDLVRVFKSVSAGDVAWEGNVDYSYRKYHHGLQKKMKAEKWVGMFRREMPAKMERDGKTIFGALFAFCETGTEGEIWSVQEYGRNGYDGLNPLQNGDRLTVYSKVTDGDIEWEGPLSFGPEQVQKAAWVEVIRATGHMKTEDWLNLSWGRRPVIVTPK